MEDKNKDIVFKTIQTYLTDTPVVLAGTGISIPAGIPGMNKLSKFLQDNLKVKYEKNSIWCKISDRLDEGIDLESALTGVDIKGELLTDIVKLTWKLVTEYDLKFFNENVLSRVRQPLCDLIAKLMSTCYNNVNIITTNYDRYIEYCCDICGVEIDNRFNGMYLKSLNNAKCYLCIGYGFNDSQIQQNILNNITFGKPIVVVTKELSDAALSLINNKAREYAVLIESPSNKTRVIINKKESEIDGEYWKLENFLEMI